MLLSLSTGNPETGYAILMLFRTLPANTRGRDFVVGDVHGCFDTLGLLLGQVDFDPERDRLLSVGDLIDRGPGSWQVLDWLAQMWLFAVRGNHEQMAIDYDASDAWRERYARNGGEWFMALPRRSSSVTAMCLPPCRWQSSCR